MQARSSPFCLPAWPIIINIAVAASATVALSHNCPLPPLLLPLLLLPQMIEDAGFRGVSYVNLTMGVVAIHDGFKMA